MNPNMMCSRCKKRLAVVFLTRMDGDKPVNEGLCLKCAKELNIKAVTDLLDKMGITDEQLDAMDDQVSGLLDSFGDSFDMGGAQSMPFMQMFNMPAQQEEPEDESELDGDYAGGELESYEQEEADGVQQEDRRSSKQKRQQEKERKKYKFLPAHCENLTQKAKDGKIDHIVGRDKEIERVIQILNRRTKNNPCLIGEPGVGKTAIAEGIAQKLADEGIGMCRDGQLFLIRHAVAADILPAFIGKRASWDTRRVKQLRRERRHDDRAVISDHIHERFDQRLFTGHHIGQTPRGHFHEQHHPPGQTKAAQLFDQLRLRQHRIVHFSHIHIITHIHHPLYRLFYHIF